MFINLKKHFFFFKVQLGTCSNNEKLKCWVTVTCIKRVEETNYKLHIHGIIWEEDRYRIILDFEWVCL